MGTVTFSSKYGIDFYQLAQEDLSTILNYDKEQFLPSAITFSDADGDSMRFTGTKLVYIKSKGEVVGIKSGTITGLTMVEGGQKIVEAKGLSVKGVDLAKAIDSGSTQQFLDTLLSGNDTIKGSAADDRLWGADGNDRVDGGAGNDTLWGEAGKDTLIGGAGADWLWGGTGNDILTGGAGSDTFAFSLGKDKVTDFKAKGSSADLVDLRFDIDVNDFATLRSSHMKQSGANVVIYDGAGDTLTLTNVKISDLSESNFLF
ncbi:hypothetical protein BTR14_21320 [Rhizobium rhizosphaerae]|uniref:Hemolysin type calcium-binding protein n=1 Tax=Xaviernesmea rhizosphaerae TaxID=1672749 RepID=A0ABX3P7L5_9HYPH|nr:calcium-binding protein [Xaviernesmea rhizosphaerae]OQP83884.1 hypothetical protein BTR14_21320 [Xaviernesmea rhizosphaerae]